MVQANRRQGYTYFYNYLSYGILGAMAFWEYYEVRFASLPLDLSRGSVRAKLYLMERKSHHMIW